jgi:hypothetical protein
MLRDEIAHAVAATTRFLLVTVIWQCVLFNLGRMTLLLLTAGRYPRGRTLGLHTQRITCMGMVVLLGVWMVVALYNHLYS